MPAAILPFLPPTPRSLAGFIVTILIASTSGNPHCLTQFFTESLDYLEKSGRIGKAQAVLGAMLDAGLSLETLRKGLAKLGCGRFEIAKRRVRRANEREGLRSRKEGGWNYAVQGTVEVLTLDF